MSFTSSIRYLLHSIVLIIVSSVGNIAGAQERAFISMQDRFDQVAAIIEKGENCAAVQTAIDLGFETQYGGARIVRTKGVEQSFAADRSLSESEHKIANILRGLVESGRCPELAGQALDLKLRIEQINEVAEAVGRVTRNCGDGDDLVEGDCSQLHPVLDEDTGHILDPSAGPRLIKPGFFVKLRGPFVPRHIYDWNEDVRVTRPIAPGQCTAVFKETKGLMLELRFAGFTVVRDPWATPQLLRGTNIPVWTLQWIPSQYVKIWNICNRNGKIERTVSQRVKQDRGLNYFWRYFPKAGH